MADREVSLSQFLTSLASGFIDVLRHNKIATSLSAIALVATTILAVSSQYDERPRYRQVLLPDIERADSRFLEMIDAAAKTSDEQRRLYYFISAHQKAREALKVLKSRKPHTPEGLRAHDDLIHYYEAVNEELAIIRTEMSIHEELDYLDEWNKYRTEIWPLHERWTFWVKSGG